LDLRRRAHIEATKAWRAGQGRLLREPFVPQRTVTS
jgi:hypothetical protein